MLADMLESKHTMRYDTKIKLQLARRQNAVKMQKMIYDGKFILRINYQFAWFNENKYTYSFAVNELSDAVH